MPRQRWALTPRKEPVPTPAPGVNWSRTNDSGGTWLVRSIMFRFVTAAAAANRIVSVVATSAEDRWFLTTSGLAQAATLTADYSAFPGAAPTVALGPAGLLALPDDGLWLPPGHVIASEVSAIQAADQLSAIVLTVIEMPEVLPEHYLPGTPVYTEDDQE
jgi:hypothetical protein